MKIKLLCSLALCLLLFSCNGARVTGNVYQAGSQPYVVGDDFRYIGSPPASRLAGTCTGDGCRPLATAKSRMVSDMFVASENGESVEFVTFIQLRVARPYYYPSLSGPEFVLAGKTFVEEFSAFEHRAGNDAMGDFLRNANVDADGVNFFVINLVRNTGQTTREVISYACRLSLVPEDIKGDIEKEKEFLRQRMLERVYSAG